MTMEANKERAVFYLKKTVGIVIVPLLSFIIMSIACAAAGTTLFKGSSTLNLYFRGFTYVLLVAFGVSINMHSGRFDFSTGATMMIGGVIGAKLSVALGWGPWDMLLFGAVFGALFGTITGLLYVALKLPPMIIGLGMTLVLEGLIAIITGGLKPVSFGTNGAYYTFVTTPWIMILIAAVALAIMVFIFHFTKFGYDYRALQSGQKIAVNTGVDENKNAVLCYLLAGFFFGAAGAISICSTNGVTPTINFTTIASMFTCFLPLFFSDFIQKFCNKQVAILLGCAAYEFIQIGFGQINFMNAAFTSDVYKVVEAVILVLFLIYLNNENKINEFVTLKKLREKRKNTVQNG